MTNLPNIFTFFNLLCGIFSVYFSVHADFTKAAWLILLGVFFDSVDGKIAAWLDAETEFGRLFDAFSDLITFGVAASFLVWRAASALFGPALNALCLAYFLACFFRLLRFYIGRSEAHFFKGLPTTASSLILMLVFLSFRVSARLEGVLLASMLILSAAMISAFPIPNPKFWIRQRER